MVNSPPMRRLARRVFTWIGRLMDQPPGVSGGTAVGGQHVVVRPLADADAHERLLLVFVGWFVPPLVAGFVAYALIADPPALKARRERLGLCPECGYDLRASPGRCPECGATAAPPPPPS